MNIVLFEPGEELRPLPREDPRGSHLIQILKVVPGQSVRAGIVGGAEGTIEITAVTPAAVVFVWRPGEPEVVQPEAALPGRPGREPGSRLLVLLGHPRPPVLRRLFKDLTTIGAAEILVAAGELTEKSYFDSKIWEPGALRGALIEGAAQGGTTRIPEVRRFYALRRAVEYLDNASSPGPGAGELRLLLDQYAECPLFSLPSGCGRPSATTQTHRRGVLSVGPERGWTEAERSSLLDAGFRAVGLGDRTLRTETAALVGAAYLRSLLRMEPVSGSE
ncbi:MAG: RsmE family RNA methyltransferase [Spirochaetota bacterium]